MSRAEAFLADEYEEHKAEVQRTAAAKLGGEGLAGIDLDAAYNEAWHALYLRLQEGDEVENRKGFLVTVTYRRALSERRAARLERTADPAELAEVGVEPDIDARLDAEMQLRHFAQGLRAGLDERELQAAILCHLHGLSRPEAAKVIGVAPRRMEKLMDRASKRINAVIGAVRPGELCDDFDSLVRAFAVGLLDADGKRHAIARDHLESCPACRRKVLVLRGLGAIAPPLPALLAVLGAAGAGAKAAIGAGAKGAASKGALGQLAGKAGAVSGKAALIGGTVATATATVAVVGVLVVGGGHHTSVAGGEPASTPERGAPVAREEGEATPPPAREGAGKHREKHKPAARHRARRRRRAAPAPAPAPPVVPKPEPQVEATPVAVPEPAPEPTPEPAPTPEPPPAAESKPAAQPEPRPTTDASVEFELR